jgi:hypothetical protein
MRGTIKYKSEWSPEKFLERAEFNFNAEDKLLELMSEGLVTAIDREIIKEILGSDIQRWWDNWSFKEDLKIDLFPIAQQVFAKTVASELVEVQPMSAPSGILHYLDYNLNDVNMQTHTFSPSPNVAGRYTKQDENLMYLLLG